MDRDTARRLRLKHSASAAESAGATLENLRIDIVVNHCESDFSDHAPEQFGAALAQEIDSIMKRVREIYADLDHLALSDDPEGAIWEDCRHRLRHGGAEPCGTCHGTGDHSDFVDGVNVPVTSACPECDGTGDRVREAAAA